MCWIYNVQRFKIYAREHRRYHYRWCRGLTKRYVKDRHWRFACCTKSALFIQLFAITEEAGSRVRYRLVIVATEKNSRETNHTCTKNYSLFCFRKTSQIAVIVKFLINKICVKKFSNNIYHRWYIVYYICRKNINILDILYFLN